MAANRAREAAPQEQPAVEIDAVATVEQDAMDPMEARLARFMARFEERLSKTTDSIVSHVDQKIQEVRAEVGEAAAMTRAQEAAGMIPPQAVTAGGSVQVPGLPGNMVVGSDGTLRLQPVQEHPTAATLAARQSAERKVAFIPKDDPLNPKSISFDCWLNGNRIRIKRGDVGMLPLGFAIDLARAGHGHVIDMAAWQQIPVQTLPDESLKNASDGPPIPDPNVTPGLVSSIPRSWLSANPL